MQPSCKASDRSIVKHRQNCHGSIYPTPRSLLLAITTTNMSPATAEASHISFSYQSSTITFESWITFFTLCFAPLITHIVFGLPEKVVLSAKGPSWHDQITQANPITIGWRYFAIAYRRVRARQWDKIDMAASNAVFWHADDGGWNGSEQMMTKCRPWITKLPESTHTAICSGSAIATVAIALQGVREVYLEIQSWKHQARTRSYDVNLTDVFFPLAIISLIRLVAAPWLTDKWGFGLETPIAYGQSVSEMPSFINGDTDLPTTKIRVVVADAEGSVYPEFDRLMSQRTRQARAFLGLWCAVVTITGPLCFLSTAMSLGPRPGTVITTSTGLLFRIFYMSVEAGVFLIHLTYLVRGNAGNVVIPCISSWWYKLYTLYLAALAVAMVVVGCLELRVRMDGTLTSSPGS